MDDLLQEFLTETNEHLAVLDSELVRLEQNPGEKEILGNIFRMVHTIKGTCGFLALPRLETLAHAGENVLGKIRDGLLTATPEAIGLVLQAIDQIKRILATIEATEREPDGNDRTLVERLNDLAAQTGAPVPEKVSAPAPEPAAATPDSALAAQTIRVNVALLESLMTMASELVLTRNQLLQVLRGQKDSPFAAPLQRLSHVTTELQEGVMKTRMQPIGNAWGKLPRLVRDLSHELGKPIELVLHGAETELDRQVLELIKDPLTHMVRNSADHGIETPAERRAAGKSEAGTITLNACHEGGYILLEIGDDGHGLPTDRIKEKVLANGLAGESELAAMTEPQIQQFIFRPGFSTAAEVTNLSGRGVGMDVVRSNIEKIGGTIELRSQSGRGTHFIIKIPLTLAIVSALIVECAGERFAIPQLSVVELVRIGGNSEHRIEWLRDAAVLRLRDRLLPLVSLRDTLKLGPADGDRHDTFIVVTKVGSNSFGIVVDRVDDTEEIVVKPVAPILRHIPIFSGNTILGDGSVVMILDPNGIAATVDMVRLERGDHPLEARRQSGDERLTSLLLFRAGPDGPKAVPLSLIARLEEIDLATVERVNGRPVVQYRNKLMPLVTIGGESSLNGEGCRPVLVFADQGNVMGLMVDEILDIVDETIKVDLAIGQDGLIGSSVIAGKATELVDAAYYLTRARADWFGTASERRTSGTNQDKRVLLVDDSPFFRNMLTPLLAAAGYDVTTVDSADEALALCAAGEDFDAIVSDIEMPGMDGFSFASALRKDSRWRDKPLLALSSRATRRDFERGREAGFSDYISKSDRDGLLTRLSDVVGKRKSA